jgi:DNA-binding FadR family transcriptional regulator
MVTDRGAAAKVPAKKRAAPAKRAARRVRFTPVNGVRPADAIHSQIRFLLARRELAAGDRLPSERELAEQFGVSRNSVRQALRSLVDSGLLEMKKGAHGGAFVRDGGGDAVRTVLTDLYTLGTIQPAHLTEVRVLIGVEIVRLACERGSDEEIDALERNVAQAMEAARAKDYPRRTVLNLEFYRMLARMTRNPLLEILTDAVNAVTQRFVEEVMRTSNVSVMPFRHQLLADLRARDAQAATEHMREHLLELQKIYLAAGRRKPRTAA